MCSTPKMPPPAPVPDPIVAPTYADADVQKAGQNTRDKRQALANRNITTTALGLTEQATTKKTKLGE